MSEQKQFNPILTARAIEDLYREYIATTIHFSDAELQAQLEGILNERRFLAKGPFLEAAPPYKLASSLRDLVQDGVLCSSMLDLGGFDVDRPLYVHQEKAIRKAIEGRNYAVVTGTGSGKTESFLLPIINDILAEFEEKGSSSGVRAMILYPMNALANDQLKRLRELLAGTEITFGRYTGDTETKQNDAKKKWLSENPGQTLLPNEIIAREVIRENPPNILLTNYSMLEYLLLRPEDASLFGSVFGANWRHIAIDEAHVYTGALGTEIAYLIRRLKARIASEVGETPNLHCYATSATIGSEEDIPSVAQFAQGLFGEPFSSDPIDLDVITSAKDSPVDALDGVSWGTLPLSVWRELREFIRMDSEDARDDLIRILSSCVPEQALARLEEPADLLMGLGSILLGESSSMALVRRLSSDLLDLTDIDEMNSIGIEGLAGDEDGIETLSAMVEVLSWAQRSKGVPILTSRYHSFLRAPEGIFLNVRENKLRQHKTTLEISPEGYEVPVYEASVCRHCGQAYILGREDTVSDDNPNTWLNPRHSGIDADDEFIPRDYYRIVPDDEIADPGETVQWLCPICGSLSEEKDGVNHRFSHEPCKRVELAFNSAKEGDAKCSHCGYTSPIAIQGMRVSPEAAGSIVCYDLVRDIPSFKGESETKTQSRFSKKEKKHGGNVICFSDKRQDAAFFAPAMKRTYGSITIRQLIREAVEARSSNGDGCTPTQVCKWIAETGFKRYAGFMDAGAKEDQAEAWVIDELTAEDSRNSLEGLGVVRVEPSRFIESFDDEDVRAVIEDDVAELKRKLPWITVEDYGVFAVQSLETLRERGAIEVPAGVETYRMNHMIHANDVVYGDETSTKWDIKFVGSISSAVENKRSAFIRKYARRVYQVDVTRDEARLILGKIYDFLVDYLGGYFEEEKYLIGNRESFQINKNIWRMYPHRDDDVVFRCDTCGCEWHLDTHGVCATNKCEGTLQKMTFAEAKSKDRFYKDIYCEEALPLEIEEHTAQLSSERARLVQSRFIEGDVNVLSCTTTFELGVDVGDLRAIFMRNVPPSTANYTQRAGRVGRRAGMPGYALTFCRLRPHDIAHFEDPRKIISGDTMVPFCYMENSEIAIRHVFAVALSEFFRYMRDTGQKDLSHTYNDFMSLSVDKPHGLELLINYLESHPENVANQLRSIFPSDDQVSIDLGIDEWGWIPELVADGKGRLCRTHDIKRSDYVRIEETLNNSSDSNERSKLEKSKGALEAELAIPTLAENGVLPKYGFPTDLVELHLAELDHEKKEKRLRLQRGLRQAIREYAPGSEIVAGGVVWRSIGIRKKKGHELIRRAYGKCECGTFVWPIDNLKDEGECPVCHRVVPLKKKMLIPSLGFEGVRVKKGVGLRKPRSAGYAKVFFSQHSLNEVVPFKHIFSGGVVEVKYSGNGQLCVVNSNGDIGFQICNYCGSSAGFQADVRHTSYCQKLNPSPSYGRVDALGAAFVSDVLELDLIIDDQLKTDPSDWESVMWAVFTAAAKLLDIPQSELGGTLYENDHGAMSLLIYDDVPGGAGHTRQLSEMVDELLQEAYTIVSDCSCGEETCCYGCIANYYNQMRQAELSRGAAKAILGALLGKTESNDCGKEGVAETLEVPADGAADNMTDAVTVGLRVLRAGAKTGGLTFSEVCEMSVSVPGISDEWQSLLNNMSVNAEGVSYEVPLINVNMGDDYGHEALVPLVWADSKVILLDAEDLEDFEEAFGRLEQISGDWRIFSAGDVTAEQLLSELKRDQ